MREFEDTNRTSRNPFKLKDELSRKEFVPWFSYQLLEN
jgi:hypothetical protein